jgi:hypothetical protein
MPKKIIRAQTRGRKLDELDGSDAVLAAALCATHRRIVERPLKLNCRNGCRRQWPRMLNRLVARRRPMSWCYVGSPLTRA